MEETSKKTLEKRKEKIINWLKNPYNLTFLFILVFAFAIRLYFFILTKNQPLWWDEAEYMNMAKAWAFGLDYQFLPIRAILFSLMSALFFKIINNGDTVLMLLRIFMFLLSIACVIGIYYLGKEVYNKRVGLLSCFFMSVFWLNLFFTYRLLVDIFSLSFFTFSAFLFYKYFKTNSNKALYLAAALVAIGTLFKQSTAFILFGILIYLLVTEKLNFLKKREIWIAVLIFLLIIFPYLIWGYIKFGGFVFTQAASKTAPENYFITGFNVLKNYLVLFPSYFSWPLLIIFLLGIISMYKLFLGFDILIKNRDNKLKRDLFLMIIFLTPLLLISILISHNENRYILNSIPAAFIISSIFVMKSYKFIKEKSKFFAVIFLIILLGYVTFFQLQSADSIIKNKLNSYIQVKEAGLWLKENSEVPDIIVTGSTAQIKYYSERGVVRLPKTKEELESLLSSNPNIKFYIISIFEWPPEWAYAYPNENNLTMVKAYFAEPNQQPILIIYEL